MAKRKVVRETAKWRRSEVKVQGPGFQQEKHFWKVVWLH